jgi:hypothetical protein
MRVAPWVPWAPCVPGTQHTSKKDLVHCRVMPEHVPWDPTAFMALVQPFLHVSAPTKQEEEEEEVFIDS